MIIAVDFDGTIMLPGGNPNAQLIQCLRASQRNGNIVILWSCRTGSRLADAVKFCQKNGLNPNYVNANAPQAIRMLGSDPRKIYADIYIDDKNAR